MHCPIFFRANIHSLYKRNYLLRMKIVIKNIKQLIHPSKITSIHLLRIMLNIRFLFSCYNNLITKMI